jgi:NAD(P)-dependent dehydrogenase (short-subunit alcohol dehydrogenase family)
VFAPYSGSKSFFTTFERRQRTIVELDQRHGVNARDLFELGGKVAVVTGGARGLGFAFAEALAEYGADVAVFDIGTPVPEFKEMSRKYGVRTFFIKTDITDPEAIETSVAQVVDTLGGVDICVASAGVAIEEDFLTTSPEQLRNLLAVNTEGLYFTNQSVVRQMVKQERGGSIVNISSIAGVKAIRSQPNTTSYAATKGAVIAHTRTLAAELAPNRIRVNSIAPGFIYTDMIKRYAMQRPEQLKLWQDETMLGDLGATHELKGGIIYLCSDASRFVTGQNICIDGGISSK